VPVQGDQASWRRRAVLGWAVLSGGLGVAGLATGTALFARAE
jgi:hypothetical protein